MKFKRKLELNQIYLAKNPLFLNIHGEFKIRVTFYDNIYVRGFATEGKYKDNYLTFYTKNILRRIQKQ